MDTRGFTNTGCSEFASRIGAKVDATRNQLIITPEEEDELLGRLG